MHSYNTYELTWKEAQRLIDVTNSVQFKAILATQLDGGFRPSEFIDLNYGDVKIKGNFIVVQVKDGKTGGRSVILYKSVPYLLKWYQAHQTKKAKDPLWLQEGQTNGKIIRYKYPAIVKRIKKLFNQIKLDKPSDFYALRHSAVSISKIELVPDSLAADKFGHSFDYYKEVYGRLSINDELERYSKHYGLEQEKEELAQNVSCRCGYVKIGRSVRYNLEDVIQFMESRKIQTEDSE